jgi:hypothetical protein
MGRGPRAPSAGDAGSWVSSSSPGRSPHHRSASHPTPGAPRSHALVKYPSGMSAMSGASTIGSGSNPAGFSQYYDDGAAAQHGAPLGVNGSQPATPSPVNDHNSRNGGADSVSGFPPELLAILERKSCTGERRWRCPIGRLPARPGPCLQRSRSHCSLSAAALGLPRPAPWCCAEYSQPPLRSNW